MTYKAFYETSGVGVGVGGWLEVFCTNKAFHETSGVGVVMIKIELRVLGVIFHDRVAGGVSAGMFNGVR